MKPSTSIPACLHSAISPGVPTPGMAEASLRVNAFGLTDRGRERSVNEDQFLIATLTPALKVERTSLPQPLVQYGSGRGCLFIVADGIGGHHGGQQASALAVDSIERFVLQTMGWFWQLRETEGKSILTEFQNALRQSDQRLFQEANAHPELSGMGTTLTMAYSVDRDLFIIHVGANRCYLARGQQFKQLTHDHTLVGEMVDKGLLAGTQSKEHPWRHVVTNVVGGTRPGVQPEVHKLRLQAGDTLLLCSDGLTNMVAAESIAAIVQAEPVPRRACARLVARANENGGRDNVTVVLARYEA